MGVPAYELERLPSGVDLGGLYELAASLQPSPAEADTVTAVAVAHASLDVNGTPVNAEAAAGTYQEAVDLLHDRLQHQLADMGR